MKSLTEFRIQSAWNKTGLLKGLNEQAATQCALVLQAQRNFNEEFAEVQTPAWLRASIPVVRRLFGAIPSLNAALGEWYNTGIKADRIFVEGDGAGDLDAEAAASAVITETLANYMKRKAIDTLGGVKVENGTFWLR